MSRRLRVLLDADGVLLNFLEPCLRIINRRMIMAGLWTEPRLLDEMRSWHIFDSLGVPKDVETAVYDEMTQPGWCRSLEPFDGAVAGVELLREISDVYVVTSPMKGPTWTHERDHCLMSHFGFTTKQIIHASAKYVCAGDALVDDRTDNLIKWHEHNPSGLPIRWRIVTNDEQPWSGHHTDSWAMVRTWVEAHHERELERTWRH